MAVVFGHSVDENDPYPKKFNGAILVDGVLIDRNSTIDEINCALIRNKPRSNRFTPFINSSVHFDRHLYDECNPEVVQNIYQDDNGEATLDSFNFSIAVTHLQGKTEN